jgi:uncharacterized protein YjiS (DUF1127 family)
LLIEILLGKKRFLEFQRTYKTEYERKFILTNGNDESQILPPTAEQLWAAIKIVITNRQEATIQAVQLQAEEKYMQHYHDGLSTEFKIRKGKGKIFIDNKILDYNADAPAKNAFYISPGGAHGFEAETETIFTVRSSSSIVNLRTQTADFRMRVTNTLDMPLPKAARIRLGTARWRFGRVIRTISRTFRALARVQRARRDLLDMSGYQLCDIGANRCDVFQIRRQPLWKRVRKELADYPDL